MQYKDWDGNLLPDPAPRIHNVHIGDIIKTTHKSIEEPLETRGRGQHRFISETREYEVIEVIRARSRHETARLDLQGAFLTAIY